MKGPFHAVEHAMGDEQESSQPQATRRRSLFSLRGIALGLVLGTALTCFGLIGLLAVFAPRSLPALTQERLNAARSRWEEGGPASYHLQIQVKGNAPGLYELTVKEGKVVEATINGRPPARHTWDTWKVPSQFEFIQRELDGAAQPGKVFGVEGATVVQRAEFDAEYGYPQRYLRHVLGTDLAIEWKVLEFESLDSP